MIIKFVIALFLICFLMIGAQLYQSDQEYGVTRDIYNYTEEKINVPLSNISSLHPIERTKGVVNIGRLYQIIESGINFIFVSSEQVIKMGIEYGYQNPTIPWEKIVSLVILILIVWLAICLMKPIGYLLVFIFMLIMMIVDKRKKRKEMREKNGII